MVGDREGRIVREDVLIVDGKPQLWGASGSLEGSSSKGVSRGRYAHEWRIPCICGTVMKETIHREQSSCCLVYLGLRHAEHQPPLDADKADDLVRIRQDAYVKWCHAQPGA